MAEVLVRANPAIPVKWPPLCICCGAQASQNRLHKFWYEPTWLIVFTTLMPRLRRFIPGVYTYFEMNPPVCHAHRNRLSWPNYLSWALLGLLFTALAVLIPAALLEWHAVLMVGLIALPFGAILVGLLNIVVRVSTPRMIQYDHRHIRLGAVNEQFAAALGYLEGTGPQPGYGAGFAVPAAGYGQPQAYAQPAYGQPAYAPQAAGASSANLRTILISLVAVIGIFGVLACGGIGLVSLARMGRNQRMAEVNRMATEAQERVEQQRREFEEQMATNRAMTMPPTRPPLVFPSDNTAPPRPPASITLSPARSTPPVAESTTISSPPMPPVVTDFPPGFPPNFPPDFGPTIGSLPQGAPPFPSGPRNLPPRGNLPGFAIARGTDVKAGDAIHILWGSRWFTGKVVETAADKVKVHYDQYDATWDEWATLDRVRAAKQPTSAASPAPPASTASAPAAPTSKLRTWTDTTGKFKIEAEFVAMEKGQVHLKKDDGTTIAVPFDKLSVADQEFAIQQ